MNIEIKIPERYTLGEDWVPSDNSVFVFSPVDGTMEVRIVTPDEQTFFINFSDLRKVFNLLDLLMSLGVPRAADREHCEKGEEVRNDRSGTV